MTMGCHIKTAVRTKTLRRALKFKPIRKETYGSTQKKTVQSGIITHQEERVQLARNQHGNTCDYVDGGEFLPTGLYKI
jgi:hypothetical protein